MKIVIDTNILIAIIGSKSPFRWIFDCLVKGKMTLCVSNEILTEYTEVMVRKNGTEVAENLIKFITISPFTERIETYFRFQLITEDSDDNKFVDCAIAANVDCLLSNDGHFQILKKIDFPTVNIITLSEFELQFKSQLITQIEQ